MVWDVAVQGFVSAFAGITAAGFSAWISRHRERQIWVESEVYQPIYNEIHNAAVGDIVESKKSSWRNFSYFKKRRVDDELREKLDLYLSKVQELSGIEDRDIHERWYRWIAEELPNGMVDENDERRLKASIFETPGNVYKDMDTWYKRHLPLFDRLDRNQLDDYSMKDELRNHSEKNNWGYKQLYQHWSDDANSEIGLNWGSKLYSAYGNAIMGTAVEEDIAYTAYLRRQIQDEACDIEELINIRMEQNIFKRILKNII